MTRIKINAGTLVFRISEKNTKQIALRDAVEVEAVRMYGRGYSYQIDGTDYYCPENSAKEVVS